MQTMEYKDYYKILCIKKAATQEEIKKSYRDLARKYHPDKNKGDKAAEEKFKEINEAYEVLKNPESRKKYDQLGYNWKKYQNINNFGNTGGNYNSTFNRDFGDAFGEGKGFSDFFRQFFGAGFGGRQKYSSSTSQRKGADLKGNLTISLEEAFTGTSKLININGEKLRLKINPGVEDNQTMRIRGKGRQATYNEPKGDLFLKISISKHPVFERKKNDLYRDAAIDLYTAILGGSVNIKTLKGDVSIKIPGETDYGKIFRLKNLGMPDYSNNTITGDLYAKIKIKMPKNLSKEEISLFRKLAKRNKLK